MRQIFCYNNAYVNRKFPCQNQVVEQVVINLFRTWLSVHTVRPQDKALYENDLRCDANLFQVAKAVLNCFWLNVAEAQLCALPNLSQSPVYSFSTQLPMCKPSGVSTCGEILICPLNDLNVNASLRHHWFARAHWLMQTLSKGLTCKRQPSLLSWLLS